MTPVSHANDDQIAAPRKPPRKRPFRPYQPRQKPSPALAIPNRTTRDGKHLRQMRADLVRHVGGIPSAPQEILIDRIVVLQWQSMVLDRAAQGARPVQAAEMANASIVLLNALGRALTRLGLTPAKPRTPTLQEHLAAKAAAKVATP